MEYFLITKSSFKTNAKTCQRAIVLYGGGEWGRGQKLDVDISMSTNCASALFKIVNCLQLVQSYVFGL